MADSAMAWLQREVPLMAMLPVECGVPLPDKKPGEHAVYPFLRMRVGDSFFVAVASVDKCRATQMQVHTCARDWRKYLPLLRITTRKVDGGVRVWRVE